MRSHCIDCGDMFWTNVGWKTRCYHCYKVFAQKRREEQERRREQRTARPAPSLHLVFEPDPDGEWLRTNIMKILRLCHPDQHDGSAESNEITRHLITRYKEERRKKRGKTSTE